MTIYEGASSIWRTTKQAMADGKAQILYFSWIREAVGVDEEDIALPAGVRTVRDLMAKLCEKGGNYRQAFADTDRVRAAINQTHVPLDHPVVEGDEIAFFPPVTGG